ncbi:hypothetical protein BMS3Abin03_02630 [bacterium BMS3Abin03]|nr:hypothetical protein BMS3Abin03_02630 [bacterium BMS3Abin03]
MKIIVNLLILIIGLLLLSACGNENKKTAGNSPQQNGVENSPEKDEWIQRYNLEHQKKFTSQRTPCDTIALEEFVLDNYPDGTYLVNFDKTSTYSLSKPAVIYYGKNRNFIFAVIAKSRPGERLIETKNIVGYDQSFIDLDSTDLGTAFFFLTLFECNNGNFSIIWETPIPSHGGFNRLTLKTWRSKNIPFIEVNFHYGRGIGHINYNYFLIDGLKKEPHLLMTYEGINFKRTIANVNNDLYPDYFEYIFYDLGNRVFSKDSVAFIWDKKDSVYVNTRNHRQTRLY